MAIAGGAASGVWIEYRNNRLVVNWHTGPSKNALDAGSAVANVALGDKVFILAQDWQAFDKAWREYITRSEDNANL